MPPVNPISALVNNVQASVEGFVNELLGNPVEPGVPNYQNSKNAAILSSSEIKKLQGNWSTLRFPYTFSVQRVDFGTPSPLASPFDDFPLPLSPNSIRQSEEFAISIIPTQGGTTTTHSGNRYKTLLIKGTTGIQPFRGTGGVNSKTGEAILQPKELKYKSGYEVFLRLRTWFKSYYEWKKEQGNNASSHRLVFKNYKDGEFLIVELTKFEMERQAARSFLYDYEMEFRVLSHLQFSEQQNKNNLLQDFEAALNEAVEAIDTARGVFLRSQGILRQIEGTFQSVIVEPLRKSSLALKALLGIPSVAADVGNQAISNTVSAAGALAILSGLAAQQKDNRTTGNLDPRLAGAKLPSDLAAAASNDGAQAVLNLNEALMAIDPGEFPEATRTALAEERESAANLTRTFYENALEELKRVKQNAEDFFNLGDDTYDQLFNRTATLSAPVTKTITAEELDVLQAFNDAERGLRLLLSTENLFKSNYDERIQDMVDRFDGEINLLALPAVRQIRYPSGATLERLAQRELGDSGRWGEIAEVNGLKPPYVTTDMSDTRKNILKPGDTVLIPAPSVNGFSQVPQTKEIKTTRDLNQLERSLGTDLKLTSDFDLSISNSGDLEVISGADNMAQAVLLKLSYEPGEVMLYPTLGAGVLPGQKFPPLEDIQDGIINTLLQDSRVETIEQLELRRDNQTLSVNFNLKIKQIDIPIPLSIQV